MSQSLIDSLESSRLLYCFYFNSFARCLKCIFIIFNLSILSQSDFQYFIFRTFLVWWSASRPSLMEREFSCVEAIIITKLKFYLRTAWDLSSINPSCGYSALEGCFILADRGGFFHTTRLMRWWLLLAKCCYKNLTASGVWEMKKIAPWFCFKLLIS